jgi:hypothetical protein
MLRFQVLTAASMMFRAVKTALNTVYAVELFESEALINKEFSPCLNENTTLQHYKYQLVNAI